MSNYLVIENDILKAAISPVGAELKCLQMKKTGLSLVWEGNPDIWSGSAPWLFPFVGRLKDGGFEYRGHWYKLEKHGFARKSLFEAENLNKSEALFILFQTPETLRSYPWPFKLMMTYSIEGCSLKMKAQVINTGSDTMPFSLGAHPGFYASFGDQILFDESEDLPVYRLNQSMQLLDPEPKEHFSGKELSLSPALFADDAMILKHPRSRVLTLARKAAPDIRVSFPQVPYLGLWCKPGPILPYVCIEPWYGVDDATNATASILEKEGINILEPGQEFSMDLTIEAFEKRV